MYNLRDSVWLCCSSSLCEEQITAAFPEADVGKEVMQLHVLALVQRASERNSPPVTTGFQCTFMYLELC